MEGIQRFTAGVAFATEDGVSELASELSAVAKKATLWVGIRNDVTTLQGILALLKTGVNVKVVDTARRRRIFHPKVFLARGSSSALLIIGSANLTFGGLLSNIEASALLSLDLASRDDKAFVEAVASTLESLEKHHPKHVFVVSSEEQAKQLCKQGRLVDESVTVTRTPRTHGVPQDEDVLEPMSLAGFDRTHTKRRKVPASRGRPRRTAAPTEHQETPEFELVWQSKPLTRRDLNIPLGTSSTNKTGSMLWKKGAIDEIDQRHFFRDEIFGDLDWSRDPNPSKNHYERAVADFQIVVKGVDFGAYRLRLSHNTRTDTRTYEQNNSMTSVHWGESSRIVVRPDLLGRIMYLYRRETNPPTFLVEID